MQVQLQENPWKVPSIPCAWSFWNRWKRNIWNIFSVCSSDWNDVTLQDKEFVGHKIHQNGPYIEISQKQAIDVLAEIPVEENTKGDLHCTLPMHTMYRSLLGQMNWLQSRTQFQCCCTFSRCASIAVSPTIGDVKSLSQQIGEQVKLQYLDIHGTMENIWIS